MEDEISWITSLLEQLKWRPYFENIEVKPSVRDAPQMIWTCNYISETQSYESQNIFLLQNPLIED